MHRRCRTYSRIFREHTPGGEQVARYLAPVQSAGARRLLLATEEGVAALESGSDVQGLPAGRDTSDAADAPPASFGGGNASEGVNLGGLAALGNASAVWPFRPAAASKAGGGGNDWLAAAGIEAGAAGGVDDNAVTTGHRYSGSAPVQKGDSGGGGRRAVQQTAVPEVAAGFSDRSGREIHMHLQMHLVCM